jgi:hypothetical protein
MLRCGGWLGLFLSRNRVTGRHILWRDAVFPVEPLRRHLVAQQGEHSGQEGDTYNQRWCEYSQVLQRASLLPASSLRSLWAPANALPASHRRPSHQQRSRLTAGQRAYGSCLGIVTHTPKRHGTRSWAGGAWQDRQRTSPQRHELATVACSTQIPTSTPGSHAPVARTAT